MQLNSTRRHLRAMREAPPWFLFLLLVFFASFTHSLNAQVQAGQFHLAGQFSFENNDYSGGSSFLSVFRPEIGIMLSAKWSAGLSVPFSILASSDRRPDFQMGMVGIFARRYFDLKSGFYAIFHLHTESNFNLSRRGSASWSVQATPSISYFFSPRFALEAGFGGFTYSASRTQNSVQDFKIYSNQFRIQSVPVFSLRYYFPHSTQGKITH